MFISQTRQSNARKRNNAHYLVLSLSRSLFDTKTYSAQPLLAQS